MIIHELVQEYHRSGIKRRAVIKIDLLKAYDILSSDFLFEAMVLIGFPRKYITWVQNCVKTAQFFIILNGSLVGYFHNERN